MKVCITIVMIFSFNLFSKDYLQEKREALEEYKEARKMNRDKLLNEEIQRDEYKDKVRDLYRKRTASLKKIKENRIHKNKKVDKKHPSLKVKRKEDLSAYRKDIRDNRAELKSGKISKKSFYERRKALKERNSLSRKEF